MASDLRLIPEVPAESKVKIFRLLHVGQVELKAKWPGLCHGGLGRSAELKPSGHGRTCLLDVKRQDADGSRLLEKLRQLLVASEDLSFLQ